MTSTRSTLNNLTPRAVRVSATDFPPLPPLLDETRYDEPSHIVFPGHRGAQRHNLISIPRAPPDGDGEIFVVRSTEIDD